MKLATQHYHIFMIASPPSCSESPLHFTSGQGRTLAELLQDEGWGPRNFDALCRGQYLMDKQRAIKKKRDSRDELRITIAKKLLRAIGKAE